MSGQPVILGFAHRINNILKLCFYEAARKKRITLAATTPTRQSKNFKIVIQSSSDEISSEDDIKIESPSKHTESNTSFSDLSPKAVELLDTITTSKQLVRYVKQVSKNSTVEVYFAFFQRNFYIGRIK